MENPESRPAAARLIDYVIDKHHEDMRSHLVGWSLCMKIYDALEKAGYITNFCSPPPDHCPWDCSRCHEGDGICEPEDGDWDAWEAKHAQ